MTRYAQIDSGRVVNVIDNAPGLTQWNGLQLVASATAQVGDTYAGGTFTPSADVSTSWVIHSQAFFDRFGGKEIAVRKAAFSDANVAAVVQMADARKSINLASPKMAPMLAVLVAKTLITADEATAIRTTPPAPSEIFGG